MQSEEADKLMKKGDKALEKGVFKWSKDYVSASMSYDKAAKEYLKLNNFEKVIECYEKLIPVNEKLNDDWGKARCYQSIIETLFKRDGAKIDNNLVLKNFENSIEIFAIENSQNTIYHTLELIIKEKVKNGKENEAIELYELIHLSSIKFEEKIFRKDYFLNYLRLLID